MRQLIVLDANILIRAVLGEKVPALLERYHEQVQCFTAANCYAEVRKHLPAIVIRRGLPPEPFLHAVNALEKVVIPLDETVYGDFETEAKQRIQTRDLQDWPLLALALTLHCPIWTEDKDFFGAGVATWRTQNVEIYLGQ